MSETNVKVVRHFIEDLNRGDVIAAGEDFMSDDGEIDWSRSPAPYRGVYRGREGALRFAKELQIWEAARFDACDFIEVGDDVLVPHVVHLRGRGGIELKVRATYVFTMCEQRCVRWRIFQEHDEALEAAGLSE